MVRVKSMPSKVSFSCAPFSGSSSGKTPLLAWLVDSISFLTTPSASLLSKACIAFSVDSVLLAAMKSRAFCRFALGFLRKVALAAALLKQYVLPSLSVQVMLQFVVTCCPSASPSAHWPSNCTCAGVAAAPAAARAAPGAKAARRALRQRTLPRDKRAAARSGVRSLFMCAGFPCVARRRALQR